MKCVGTLRPHKRTSLFSRTGRFRVIRQGFGTKGTLSDVCVTVAVFTGSGDTSISRDTEFSSLQVRGLSQPWRAMA